jgi:hypothetical protein
MREKLLDLLNDPLYIYSVIRTKSERVRENLMFFASSKSNTLASLVLLLNVVVVILLPRRETGL